MDTEEKICVVLPCHNEAKAIKQVIHDFKAALPEADIHVFDNASTDDTAAVAKRAGAQVHSVPRKGKGHVVQAMFRDVEANIYILADGDGTYLASAAPDMIKVLREQRADVVVATRLESYANSQSRSKHHWGNRALTGVVNRLFQSEITDLLTGYRAMSKRFVKTIPLFSQGFEVETVMSIHAIEVGAKMLEVPVKYLPRARGTESKLNTWTDGFRIALEIFTLYKDCAPKWVYGPLALTFFAAGMVIGIPVIIEFFETGIVPRFPSAILASGLMLIGFFSAFTGIILSTQAKTRREIKKLAFLSLR